MRDPTVSRTQIAFSYAGNLWIADRNGGNLRRLTQGGREQKPFFSPDGAQIAFTAQYDGMSGVYVMPSTGGEPRRLTYHPADIGTAGWTPDGKRIVFASGRSGTAPYPDENMQLFTVSAAGGFATPVLSGGSAEGSYAQDGTRIAYTPNVAWQHARDAWKRYRGGQTQPIWIAKVSDSSIEAKIPRDNSNDFNPMWVGGTVYFLSDRNGPVTIFSYDLKSREVRQVLKNDGMDIKSAAATSDAIVYEQFGSLHLLDLKSENERTLDILPAADFAETRPRFMKIDPKRIRSVALSPTGARAVFDVRGEILTAPATKGDVRNLTQTADAVERNPIWSPDGKFIAYFSDESGEYALHIRNPDGTGAVRKLNLGNPPSFYYSPTWSPDSKKIAYADKRLNIWYVDVGQPVPVHVDTLSYAQEAPSAQLAWSPDSRWIAYTKQASVLPAAYLYSLEQKKSRALTDGMTEVRQPVFDRGGDYLYFMGSTDIGLLMGGATNTQRVPTRRIFAVALGKNSPAPFPPVSNEEPAAEMAKSRPNASKVEIDFDGISRRIVALPMPAANYCRLIAGKPGFLFVEEALATEPNAIFFSVAPKKIQRFDMKARKAELVLEDVTAISLTADGEKAIYAKQERWFITSSGASGPMAAGDPLNLDNINLRIDPRTEWRHMYRQVWRDARDFFYDPSLHGLDLDAAKKKYAPYLENISTRTDLNYLFNEMLGNLIASHTGAGGGDEPKVEPVATGLLGAEYSIENNRYRFTRIYSGDPWDPERRAPLAQPGATAEPGEYLLAVDGREIRPPADVYGFFVGAAGKQIKLRVGPKPDAVGSREITVVPVDSETPLRYHAWIEDNRRKVDELTGGRVAYVHLPDTQKSGYANFNRYYFAQLDKDAVILDARYNHGGAIANDIVESLRRLSITHWHLREGKDVSIATNISGPKVMLVNEMSGSGGDALPWMFRRAGLGPLIGKRTWGGLIGVSTLPEDLLDGGFLVAANFAFYNPEGAWEIENHGVAPDIEIEQDVAAVRAGRDPQLEKAVSVVLEALQKNPPAKPQRPPYPNYYR